MRILLGLVFCLALAFHRPMMLGYYNAIYGTVTCAILVLMALLVGRNVKFSSVNYRVYKINVFIVATFAFISAFYIDIEQVLKGVIVNVIFVTTCFSLSGRSGIDRVLTGLKYGFRVIVFFGLVTSFLSGFNFDRLHELELMRLPLKDRGYMSEFSLIFPLSTLPYPMTLPEFVLPRNTYLTIEPGVAPLLLLVWRVLEGSKNHRVMNIFYDLIFILALISTFSTTATIFLFIYFGMRGRLNSVSPGKLNRFVLVLALIFSIFALLYAPYIGFFDKVETHGTSFEERQAWYSSAEGIGLRIINVPLLIIYYLSLRKHVNSRFTMLYIGTVVVSLLNVVAFTPMFYLISFICSQSYFGRQVKYFVFDNVPSKVR